MTHGERLRLRRLQYGRAAELDDGYTQEQIAGVMEVSQGWYSQLEAGEKHAPYLRMLALCRFYGVKIVEAFPEYRPTRAEKQMIELARQG